MSTQIQMAERFLALHRQQQPLLLPNPWDLGSAKLLAWLGFSALATTSGGFAATVGRLDGKVRRDEALAHAAAIVEATDLPVSADLENGFADHPAGVAETVHLAAGAGLAGCSVEDFTGSPGDPIYEASLACKPLANGKRSPAHMRASNFRPHAIICSSMIDSDLPFISSRPLGALSIGENPTE